MRLNSIASFLVQLLTLLLGVSAQIYSDDPVPKCLGPYIIMLQEPTPGYVLLKNPQQSLMEQFSPGIWRGISICLPHD
jgi:hypothetical protein